MNINDLLSAPKAFPAKPLNDPSLPVQLKEFVKSAGHVEAPVAEVDEPPQAPGTLPQEPDGMEPPKAKVSASAEAGFRLLCLNSPSDTKALDDTEKMIVSKWPNYESIFENNKALLLYDIFGSIQAGMPNAPIGNLKMGFDISKAINLKTFRIHDGDELLPVALAQDAASWTSIFQKDQVLKLAPNEAVTFGSRLKVSFSSELGVSEAFTGSASLISKKMGINGKLNLSASASLSLSASFSIEDDFDVIIIRLPADEEGKSKFQVSLSREKESKTDISAAAGITAGIDQDEDFAALVDQFFVAIDRKVFEPLMKQINHLDASMQPVLAKASTMLGSPEPIDSPEEFKAFYLQKRAEIKAELMKILGAKVSVGVSYEYSKMESEDTVYSAIMSESFLDTHFKSVRGFDINTLLAQAQPNDDYEITEFLKRDVKEVKKSFGISLSLGNFKLGSTKTRTLKSVKEQKLIKHEICYRVESYSEGITQEFVHGKNTDKFYMSFEAAMPEYAKSEEGQTADMFQYGFGLSVESLENTTTDEELKNYVDWALVWDIIDQDQFHPTIERIREDILEKSEDPVRFSLSLGLGSCDSDSQLFKEIIKGLGNATDIQLTDALAAATPYAEYQGEPLLLRATMDFRRLNYASFWATHLKTNQSNKGEKYSFKIAKALAKSITAVDEVSARFERGPFTLNEFDFEPARVERILDLNRYIETDIKKLTRTFKALSDSIEEQDYYEDTFSEFFDKIKKISYSKEFNLRFIGRLMLDLAKYTDMEDEIIKSLKIEYTIDGENQVMVIG